MRNLGLVLICIFGLFACTGAQAKYTKAFQYGAWEGLAFYADDTGAFNFCAIGGEYKSGMTMYIALYPQGSWQLLFYRPEGFNMGKSTFSLYTDERFIYSGQGITDGEGKFIRIDIPLSDEVIKGLKFGNTLRVSSNYGNAYFNLTGTSGAIAELSRCVVNRQGSAFGPGMEAKQPSQNNQAEASASDKPRIVPRDRLISYATEVLQNAGLSNYRILPAEKGENASKAVVWQFEDGSMGSIVAIENAESFDLDKFIGDITSDDTQSCKGDFANGKRSPRFLNGLEIRKVFTSCSAGAKSFYFDYSLVRLPSGMLVKLMTANFGSSSMPGPQTDGSQSGGDHAARTEEATLATFSKH
jgi:hypothetical protein